ncbi:MAG: hypothetical protein VR70_14330 [Rhodospirillaceae bacterium BRH_c57]|nr:MAG: hypothetical protein VR70_14330 [Rhodospirillaceae bacterium BRH_c57]
MAPGLEGSFLAQAKNILNVLEAAAITLTDRLFDALDRDRARHALGRLDDRALGDLGLAPGDRDGGG